MEGSLGRKRTWFYCLLPKGQPLVGCPCPWVTLEISARGGAVITSLQMRKLRFWELDQSVWDNSSESWCPHLWSLPSLYQNVPAKPFGRRPPHPVTCQMCLLPLGNQPRPGLVTWWDLGYFYLPCPSHPPCLCVLTFKDEFFDVPVLFVFFFPVLFLSGFLAVRIVGLGRRWLGL